MVYVIDQSEGGKEGDTDYNKIYFPSFDELDSKETFDQDKEEFLNYANLDENEKEALKHSRL